MKRKALAALLAALLLVSALPLSALADTAYNATATVTASWLRYRQGPSVNTASYAQEPRGTKVTISKKSTMGWWYYCTGPHGSGWMYYKYLTNITAGTAAKTTGKTTGKTTAAATTAALKNGAKCVISNRGNYVNFRTGASLDSSVIAKLPDGTPVTLVAYGAVWSQVKVFGLKGFVKTNLLKAK